MSILLKLSEHLDLIQVILGGEAVFALMLVLKFKAKRDRLRQQKELIEEMDGYLNMGGSTKR